MNGWLFDLEKPETFHAALGQIKKNPEQRRQSIECGRELVREKYDVRQLGSQVARIYLELCERKGVCDT